MGFLDLFQYNDHLSRFRDSGYKDNTHMAKSYPYNGNSLTDQMAYL